MDGTVEVHTYDWQSFLSEHLNKLAGIKSFHHLRFPAINKGHVFEVRCCGSGLQLAEGSQVARASNSIQASSGHKILPSQDITCPLPLVPKPSTAVGPLQLLLVYQPVLPPPPTPASSMALWGLQKETQRSFFPH